MSSSTVLSISLSHGLSLNLYPPICLDCLASKSQGSPEAASSVLGFQECLHAQFLKLVLGDKPQVMIEEQAPYRLNCVPKHRHYKLNN